MSDSFKGVVVGGGSGAPLSIRTLLAMGAETSAVVAMADDGGSTGILRERAGMIPPGDVRSCLTAMAADQKDPMLKAFKYRFDYAQNHALGNLILTALTEVTGSFPEAIRVCGEHLDCRGNVYPSTIDDIKIMGKTRDGKIVHGEASLCKTDCALETVWIDAEEPPQVYEPAAQALREADIIVLGPGSLFTSIIPNLLVPGILEAIHDSKALTVFVCSLADMQGETWGMDAAEHVKSLLDHGMQGRLDIVLVHCPDADGYEGGYTTPHPSELSLLYKTPAEIADSSVPKTLAERTIRPVKADSEIIAKIEAMGPAVIKRSFTDPRYPTWHSPDIFRETLEGVWNSCRSLQK